MNSLPDRLPFTEMMAFHSPECVELTVQVQTLTRCSDCQRMFIDGLAEDLNKLPGDIFVFTYMPLQWQRLCIQLALCDRRPHSPHAAPRPHGRPLPIAPNDKRYSPFSRGTQGDTA